MNSSLALHNIFSDHMVVQREKPIRFSGTAAAGSVINGVFAGMRTSTETDLDGNWTLVFDPLPAGGPHTLVVSHSAHGTARITVRDILVGDVWFCSGQSNMEFPVWGDNQYFRLKDGVELAEAANDDSIRLFQSPLCVAPDAPCTEPPGRPSWKPATTPEAVKEFSAVGYWFGLALRKALSDKIPLGLINSSWGGTMIEPWISEASYQAAGRQHELTLIQNARALRTEKDDHSDEKAAQEFALANAAVWTWLREKYFQTDPATTADALAHWALPDNDLANWQSVPNQPISLMVSRPSVVWLRCDFTLPPEFAGANVIFHADAINDCDEVYLDGDKIGETTFDTPNCWAVPRNYPAILKDSATGRHTLAIRAMDHFSNGGISGEVSITAVLNGISHPIDLLATGEWYRRTEFEVDSAKIGIRPPVPSLSADPRNNSQTPATLFNAMVNPYLDLALKGVIWYQGCSNSGNPCDYLALQKLWIDDWRRAWNDDSIPFIITQLAAYHGHSPDNRAPDDFWTIEQPGDNIGFAPLREVQDAMFDYPATGVACTIDIGDHSDIHPANKKDVGFRLANEALRLAYGNENAIPGPRFASVTQEGSALRIRFSNVGDGLAIKGDAFGPHLFAIAGADQKFVWAEATLCDDNSVLLSSPSVPNPIDAQYAFAAFPPNVNFVRKNDGFPVFPFRTNTPEYL